MKFKDMTNEELCALYQNTKCETAFEVLYKRNYKTIKGIVGKFYEYDKVLYSYEDYEQIASIAFFRAVNSFDSTKGLKFVALLYPTIKNDIGRQIKKTKSIKNNGRGKGYNFVSLNEKIPNGNNKDSEYCDLFSYENNVFIQPNEDRLIDFEFIEAFNSVKNKLNTEDRNLLENILSGKTQSDIGKEMGLTRQRVSQKVGKLRNVIKEELNV